MAAQPPPAPLTAQEYATIRRGHRTAYHLLQPKTLRSNDCTAIALSNVLPNVPLISENIEPNPGPPNRDLSRWLLHYVNGKKVVMESVSVPVVGEWKGASCSKENAPIMFAWAIQTVHAGTRMRRKDPQGYWSYRIVALDFQESDTFHGKNLRSMNPDEFRRNFKYLLWFAEYELEQFKLMSPERDYSELCNIAFLPGYPQPNDREYEYVREETYWNVWSWPGDDITINSVKPVKFERVRLATSRTAARTLRCVQAGHMRLHTPQRKELGFLFSRSGKWKEWAIVQEEVWERLIPGRGWAKRYKVTSGYDDTYIWWQFNHSNPADWDDIHRDQEEEQSLHDQAEEYRKESKRERRRGKRSPAHIQVPICVSKHKYTMYLKDAEDLNDPTGNEFEMKIPVGSMWLFDEQRRQAFEIMYEAALPVRNPISSVHLINQAFHDKGFKATIYENRRIIDLIFRSTVDEEKIQDWRFVKVLSRSPGSKVTHWVGLTPECIIEDHIVMKQFADDPTYQPIPNVFHPELFYTWYISHMADDAPLAKFRGWAVREAEPLLSQRYRLFLEHYKGGDLSSVIEAHIANGELISEAFIWIVFKNLVAACLQLKSMNLVHMNITLKSVLLGTNDNTNKKPDRFMKGYRPVLGNFSFMMQHNLPDDERVAPRSGGKPGWLSPEMIEAAFGHTQKTIDHIPVFSIGLVIWALMRRKKDGLEQHLTHPRRAGFIQTAITRSRNVTPPADIFFVTDQGQNQSVYSRELEDLMERCLSYEGSLRPTLEHLEMEVDQEVWHLKMLKKPYKEHDFSRGPLIEGLVNTTDKAEA